jgi:ribosomal protein L40E
MATLALGWVVWLSFRAAHALVKDAPVVEAGVVATGKRRKELEREKASLLKALKELDFDHQMGKVSDKDFADIGATYRGRAIRVMRQLDDAGRDYESMIAADVGKKLATATVEPSATKPEPEKCAKCGTRNDSDAEFCKKCGSKLVRDAS